MAARPDFPNDRARIAWTIGHAAAAAAIEAHGLEPDDAAMAAVDAAADQAGHDAYAVAGAFGPGWANAGWDARYEAAGRAAGRR
jgi:hypothetical protein